MLKFNGGRGAVICDVCHTMIAQDLKPSRNEAGEILSGYDLCEKCKKDHSSDEPPTEYVKCESSMPRVFHLNLVEGGDADV